MYTEEYRLLYGPEWELIRRAAKHRANHTCQECKKTFNAINLDVHHRIPISHFIEEGYTTNGPLHLCYGIPTRRPWHVEPNLQVLCMKCHAKHHKHLEELYRKHGYLRNHKA